MAHGTCLAASGKESPFDFNTFRQAGGNGGACREISCLDMITDDLIYGPAPGSVVKVDVVWRRQRRRRWWGCVAVVNSYRRCGSDSVCVVGVKTGLIMLV